MTATDACPPCWMTQTTGNDKRLSEKLNEDEKDQTRSAIEDKLENEAKKKTREASLVTLDWQDKNQLNEKDELAKNTQPVTIRTEEC